MIEQKELKNRFCAIVSMGIRDCKDMGGRPGREAYEVALCCDESCVPVDIVVAADDFIQWQNGYRNRPDWYHREEGSPSPCVDCQRSWCETPQRCAVTYQRNLSV